VTERSFREEQPIAWAFHRNTSRWPFNVVEPEESSEFQLPPKEYSDLPYVPLPPPEPFGVTLDDAIRSRFSCRRFAHAELAQAALGDLLHAAAGVLGRTHIGSLEFLERPVPSAGALYSLETYVLAPAVEGLEPGVYHYAIVTHGLEQVRAAPLHRTFLTYLFMGQHYVASAAAVLVLTSVLHRSLRKYDDRGYRYLLFEAGHMAQNANLAAAARGLGTLNLGGFFDNDLCVLLDVDAEEEIPLYALALGHTAGSDRVALRLPPE
jgi:SagB-type dehydrogenase family enzyme